MTTETKLETKDVDLHGVKVTLPADIADKIIIGRDADKAKIRDYNDKLGRLEAESAAAIAKAAKSEEDKLAIEHAKKGEIDQVRELMTREAKAREAKLSAKARDKHLAAIIAGNDGIVKTAVPDIVDQLRGKTQYNFDTETVIVLDEAGQPLKGEDGKPVEVDTYLGKWLETRTHYLLDKTPKGSGGEGAKNKNLKTISAQTFEAMTTNERAVFFKDGGSISN